MKPYLAALALLFAGTVHGQFQIGPHSTLDFATAGEAKAVLTARDDYIQRLSAFDRAAKIRSDRPVSEAEYLATVTANILPWTALDKEKITAAFTPLQAPLAALSLPLPPKILLILANGEDEGAAPYTRGNAIIIPGPKLRRPVAQTTRTLCHELFHILSRANPTLREKLYRALGFEKCGEVALPADLQPRKITNPDAPVIEHCLQVRAAGKDVWVAPVLYSSSAQFEPAEAGSFFHYLQFRLLTVNHAKGAPSLPAATLPAKPEFLEPGDVGGFFDQIGHNTPYIIHPEEVLADNFVLLVQGEPDLPSPEIVEKLKQILKEPGKTD